MSNDAKVTIPECVKLFLDSVNMEQNIRYMDMRARDGFAMIGTTGADSSEYVTAYFGDRNVHKPQTL